MEGASPCHLLVIYEDNATHDLAMEVCGGVLARFEPELAFAFSFWKFKDLNDPASTCWVAEAAARADIILFSLRGHELTPETMNWLDACAQARTKAEGALALIVAEPGVTGLALEALLSRVQHVAHRLRMDFLPLISLTPADSSVALLHQVPEELGSSHWGLNE